MKLEAALAPELLFSRWTPRRKELLIKADQMGHDIKPILNANQISPEEYADWLLAYLAGGINGLRTLKPERR
jgi:hypothetical protein